MPTESKELYVDLEVLTQEYKTGHDRNHKFLKGFGDFIVMNTYVDIQDRSGKQKNREKFQSDAWDYKFLERYFKTLASMEYEMYNLAIEEGHLSWSTIMKYVSGAVASHLDLIKKKHSKIHSTIRLDEDTFAWAWTDEMVRAGLRGIRRAGCTRSGVPLHHQGEQEKIPASHDLLKRLESIETKTESIERKLDKQTKSISRTRKIMIAGFAATALLLVGGAYIAHNFFLQKESEWETKVDRMPSQVRYQLESGFKEIGIKYIQMTGFEIDKKLSFEEQWDFFWNQLEDKKKKEFMNYATTNLKNSLSDEESLSNLIDEEQIRRFCRIFIEELTKEQR